MTDQNEVRREESSKQKEQHIEKHVDQQQTQCKEQRGDADQTFSRFCQEYRGEEDQGGMKVVYLEEFWKLFYIRFFVRLAANEAYEVQGKCAQSI